jgi:hypothetical protein
MGVGVAVSGKLMVAEAGGEMAMRNGAGLKAVSINQAKPPHTNTHRITPSPKAARRPSRL